MAEELKLDYLKSDTLDLFRVLTAPLAKPNTQTANTRMTAPLTPGEIGAAVSPNLNMDGKEVVNQVGNNFPTRGMEPEDKAKLNLLATTLMPKAAADAKFYADKAKQVMNHAVTIHEAQIGHKAAALDADLRIKGAEVKHLGAVQNWQTKTVSLVDESREKYAGIQLAASCL